VHTRAGYGTTLSKIRTRRPKTANCQLETATIESCRRKGVIQSGGSDHTDRSCAVKPFGQGPDASQPP